VRPRRYAIGAVRRRPSFGSASTSGLTPAPAMRVHDPSGVATHGVALWSAGHSRFRSARVVIALLVACPRLILRLALAPPRLMPHRLRPAARQAAAGQDRPAPRARQRTSYAPAAARYAAPAAGRSKITCRRFWRLNAPPAKLTKHAPTRGLRSSLPSSSQFRRRV
jgi:hypothetical protein